MSCNGCCCSSPKVSIKQEIQRITQRVIKQIEEFEDKAPEELYKLLENPNNFNINIVHQGNFTLATIVNKKTYTAYYGVTKRDPNDDYDYIRAIIIALSRAIKSIQCGNLAYNLSLEEGENECQNLQ